ncbi:MAG TPA: hypothetical protein VFZ23_09670 [Pyrinomonadaceae bacterium]
MKKAAVVFGLVISLAVIGFGQMRTITNATLQPFQEKRLAAERDYRDNYARMGFPSPEELDRQREVDMATRLELADQLRQARLEKERLELERRSLDIEAAMLDTQIEAARVEGGYYGGYFGGFGVGGFGFGRYGYGDRFGRFRGRNFPYERTLSGSRVTPFNVFDYTTTGPSRVFRGRIGNGSVFRGKRR